MYSNSQKPHHDYKVHEYHPEHAIRDNELIGWDVHVKRECPRDNRKEKRRPAEHGRTRKLCSVA